MVMLLLAGCLAACKPPLREAETLIQQGDYRRAEQVLKDLIQQGAEASEALPLLAQASFFTQGPEAAISQLQDLHNQHQDERVYRQVVVALTQEFEALDKLVQSGDSAQLEAYLQQKHPDALKERVRWLLASKQNKGFVALAKSDEGLIQQLARWRQAGQDPNRLASLLEDFRDSRLRPAWYQELSAILWQADRQAETLALLSRWNKELPERHPRRASVLLQEAEYALKAGRLAEALQGYKTYLRLFPKHPGGREAIYTVRDKLRPYLRAADHRFLAEQAYERWMYQTAHAEFSQVGATGAADLYRLGSYALEAKLPVPARETFERILKYHRGSREAGLASVGLASLRRQAKAYDDALAQLANIRQAYGSQPEVLAAALWEEGIIHDFRNRDDLRAAAYYRLIEADPGFKEAMSALWYAIWHDYRQGAYSKVIDTLTRHKRFYAKHELRSRFVYWQARAHEELKARDQAMALYRELSELPLMDYYGHRARERLRLLSSGGEDRYATAPYNGYTRERVPNPGYAQAFSQAIAGDKEAFSEVMELHYLKHPGFKRLAPEEEQAIYQVLHAQDQHAQGRHYETITHYRYAAEADDAYLSAAYPLAFFEHVEKEAKANGINPFLVSGQIWQESQYKPDIKSWVGATGLMQIMPATGAGIAQNLEIKSYDLTDPATNIRMGTWYLKSRHEVFDGNPLLAVASYNAGAGPVLRWKEQFGHLPYDALAESIPYPETRGYVKRVFTSYWIYQSLYGK